MRRLPIYFVIDISESMASEQVNIIESMVISIIKKMRHDPQIIESAYFSFNNLCESNFKLNQLNDLVNFNSFKLQAQKKINLNNTLKLLIHDFKSVLIPSNTTQKGDWAPIVLFFINSDTSKQKFDLIEEYKKTRTKTYILLIDKNIDKGFLTKISDEIFYLNEIDVSSFYSKILYWDDEDIFVGSEMI